MNKKALYESIMKNVAKHVVNTLNEEWESAPNARGAGSYSPEATIIGIMPQLEEITWWTREEVEDWEEEYDEDPMTVRSILRLKPGEVYDADGGLRIYVCIK